MFRRPKLILEHSSSAHKKSNTFHLYNFFEGLTQGKFNLKCFAVHLTYCDGIRSDKYRVVTSQSQYIECGLNKQKDYYKLN